MRISGSLHQQTVTPPATLPAALSFLGNWVERRPALAGVALVALTLVTHIVILSAPGFLSHDEWQKFDHVQRHGFWNYAQVYGSLQPGPEFGYPMRPIGFLQQGIAAQWMQSAPWASHLIGVLNHALVALTFVWVLRRAGLPGATAALTCVLFVLSPLTTMATGWIAASFDQLYVLFLLLAAASIVRLPADGLSPSRAIGILLATTAALLSKETAIVAPGGVLLLGYVAWAANPREFSWRPFAAALVLVLIPIAAYLLFRAPAIANSIAGNATDVYTPTLSKIPSNAFRYFVYPFRLSLFEMSDGVFGSLWQPGASFIAHLLLVGAVFWLFGFAIALAYLAAYLLFLAPVIVLPNALAHYLYGSALVMSLAIAIVLARLYAEHRARAAALVVAAVVGLSAHNLSIQARLYETGVCQSSFLESIDALIAHDAGAAGKPIRVVPDLDAPAYVAIRAVFARERYRANGVALVTFERAGDANPASPSQGTTRVRMTKACTLVPI